MRQSHYLWRRCARGAAFLEMIIQTHAFSKTAYATDSDGRPIQQLVEQLRTGVADPMLDEERIISVAKVNIRTQCNRCYTFDHRRLWCMHWAGCRALRLLFPSLRMRRSTLGDEHPDTLRSLSNLASLLQDQGKLSEAEPLFMEVLRMRRSILGDDHPDTVIRNRSCIRR